MIKAGVIETAPLDTMLLLRLLLHHPDVDLQWVYDRELRGQRVDLYHQHLTGDIDLTYCDEPDYGSIDVLITTAPCAEAALGFESLRVIDMSRSLLGREGVLYGLPELNRKHIVHDCRLVVVPDPLTTVLALSLLPLARNGILDSTVASRVQWLATPDSHITRDTALLRSGLATLQPGAAANLNVDIEVDPSGPPALMAVTRVSCARALSDVRQLYANYYDDHNFTYLVKRAPIAGEVTHTNKCLLTLERDGDTLVVKAALDPLLKGGQGTAVHLINLLFGLHERVGLNTI